MPFAIDQVQDAVFIFLSVMATFICDTLNDNNSDVSPEANIANTIVTIDIATASLGNPFALSMAIMVMLLFFFLLLALGNISLDEGSQDGWVDPVEKTASISKPLSLLDFNLVHWSEIPMQTVT
ncbi:Sulfate Permease [Phytophthora megakarya]|uniref:Sulfate Permease n=1 Tax=Phytophthora megakarya TaxID=4795 RepID=A0A225WU99_9STRA|nr:Sulfate Permease [Phytophthora megakarya]